MPPAKMLRPTYTDQAVIQRSQPDLATANLDPEQILQAAMEAEAEVNGFVGRRYTLPFTSVPPLLTAIATTIAIYRILTSAPFANAERSADSAWPDRYRAALEQLEKIADGRMVLTDETGAVIAEASVFGSAWSNTKGFVPTFGEGPDQGFTVDRDKTQAEADRRT